MQIVAKCIITEHRESLQILTYHKEACFIFSATNVNRTALLWFSDDLKLFLIQTLSV